MPTTRSATATSASSRDAAATSPSSRDVANVLKRRCHDSVWPFEEEHSNRVAPPVSLRWDYVVVNRLPKGLSSVGIKDILDAMQFR
ncbi:10993_t:CDS:2 [Paraglomus occultum]|uniref:10993_t:CDS:1 n=1 Tax=Paraglomus occultum TaxID=144539 RepID=A0A9N9ABC5_9GLOM|nr:10993_t:CDS:2 [Paraglomus occultum]